MIIHCYFLIELKYNIIVKSNVILCLNIIVFNKYDIVHAKL